jgi:hypothetical protein
LPDESGVKVGIRLLLYHMEVVSHKRGVVPKPPQVRASPHPPNSHPHTFHGCGNMQVDELQLAHVEGCATPCSSSLASSPTEPNVVAYPAGCSVVLFNTSTGQQIDFLTAKPSSKPLQCVAFSSDGKYLAAGERGQLAAVLIWDLGARRVIQELRAHKHGVGSLAWSKDGELRRPALGSNARPAPLTHPPAPMQESTWRPRGSVAMASCACGNPWLGRPSRR